MSPPWARRRVLTGYVRQPSAGYRVLVFPTAVRKRQDLTPVPTPPNIQGSASTLARTTPRKALQMVEIHLEESDRLDWALKAFKRKIPKAGILKDLPKKRYYSKPSDARPLKPAAARPRSRPGRHRQSSP